VFPVRYGLNPYILFRRNLVFKGLLILTEVHRRLTGNAMCLRYKAKPVNTVQGNNHCVL
jgi:hypothetical protein